MFGKTNSPIPEIETHVHRDLIVSASARVHFPNRFDSEMLDEVGLYVGMNVLSRGLEFEKTLVVKGLNLS